ncbi:MAG TPA: hypothetical protein VHU84_07100 [Lacipirellulaceae bacterium]|jgi:hypothetical protein|nr:hypothetical protein [Lacipirellulaceae bacterium]
MKYRKLRIAWSAVWGIAALLLLLLWVRSYWRADNVGYRRSSPTWSIVSQNGVMYAGEMYRNQPTGWIVSSRAVTDPVAAWDQFAVGYFDQRPDYACITFPHWLFLLPIIALTIAPWLSWRFRTRTLLIITTVAAGLLGLIAWASN